MVSPLIRKFIDPHPGIIDLQAPFALPKTVPESLKENGHIETVNKTKIDLKIIWYIFITIYFFFVSKYLEGIQMSKNSILDYQVSAIKRLKGAPIKKYWPTKW